MNIPGTWANPPAVWAFLFLLWVPAVPLHAQSQEIEALIHQVMAAYGEPERVKAIRANRWEATMQAHVPGEEAVVVRIVEGPAKFKVLFHYPSRLEIRVQDGGKAR